MFRLLSVALLTTALCPAEVTVVVPRSADPVEKFAASELVQFLSRIYPSDRFATTDREPASGSAIVFERKSGPAESFAIRASGSKARITAADARGSLFAVYTLLDRLGCGFYLSYTTVPPARTGSLIFDDWNIADVPLVKDRIVFDWHNFLSSASTWEFEDWKRYIDSALRMRFNDLMVHAYGNNPMFTFRFGGHAKPVGYLATTRSGRDWGTQHVNDVRRLIGGDLFDDPVFGSSVAKVAEDQRSAAAMALMKRVFSYAGERGMGVTFALDVDTESANPPAMIATLPASARIRSGKYELANPDTPEGYAFYKAQSDQLLAAYPQVTRLAIWFRNGGTPWTSMRLEDFPEAWKQEFRGDPAGAPMFAIGKLVRAFSRALREGGHDSVELAAGSWRLGFLESAGRYLPREATLMPLDWSTVFDTAAGQRALRQVQSGRKLVPIVWAHHDDRTYIGRPYTPYVNFLSLLKSSGASGFGIIHWTTRPLDLYFKSNLDQVWGTTANQPLEEACERMAVRTFGNAARERGRDYLFAFVTEAPMFGRETTDRFMDVPLADADAHIRKSRERLQMLSSIDAPEHPDHLEYFRNYERFICSFFETHLAWERAQAHLKAGDFAKARAELTKTKPEEAIGWYVRAARSGTITSGEKALVVSLNLRWLPYIVSARQAAGLEPVRFRIGKVEREPLAQGAGTNTFHVDEDGRLWKVLDHDAAAKPLRLGTIMNEQLQPGRYSINGGAPVDAQEGFVPVRLPPGADEIVVSAERR
jgi:hypothetical protein